MTMSNFKPRERSVRATKFVTLDQLEQDIGSSFVREVPLLDSGSISATCVQVYNVSGQIWEGIIPGDYVVEGPGKEYRVAGGKAFESKYESYVTRDQGFRPNPWETLGGGISVRGGPGAVGYNG